MAIAKHIPPIIELNTVTYFIARPHADVASLTSGKTGLSKANTVNIKALTTKIEPTDRNLSILNARANSFLVRRFFFDFVTFCKPQYRSTKCSRQ